jgi:hypothetical protein
LSKQINRSAKAINRRQYRVGGGALAATDVGTAYVGSIQMLGSRDVYDRFDRLSEQRVGRSD